MKKIRPLPMIAVLLLHACAKKDPSFLITETTVGPITNTTGLDELEGLFPNDSIVQDTLDSNVKTVVQKIQVFEKEGLPLLILTPSTDSVQTIENVQVLDPRYTSDDGISLISTFKDIQETYTIKKIVTTLNSLVIFPKESNLYFTIDKTELPYNLRFNQPIIEAVQIPDDAKIKYLMVGWN